MAGRVGIVLLVLALGSVAGARAADLRWIRIDVDAHLRGDGRFEVEERWEMVVPEAMTSLRKGFGFGTGQRVELRSFREVGDDGEARALEPGEPGEPGRYRYTPESAVLEWGLRPAGETTQRFVVQYEIHGAVAPSWDLAASPSAPLDFPYVTWGSPVARAREVLAAWREAWPALDRRWRLDHDVLFPDREGPGVEFGRLDYTLRYDPEWRLLDEERDLGRATPSSDYRVQRTLEYLPPGRPAAVDVRGPALRLASIAAVPAGGLFLWLAFLLREAVSRLRGPRGDRALFESEVGSRGPEVAGALLGSPVPATFERVLRRLAGERKLELEVVRPGDEDHDPVTRVRLLVPRASLRPFEREFVGALLGDARETTTEDLRRREAETGFDPEEELAEALSAALPPPVTGRRRIASLVGTLLFFCGLPLALADTAAAREPWVVFAGVVSAWFVPGLWPTGWWPAASLAAAALFLVPLAALAAACLAVHLASSSPLGVGAGGGLALMMLGGYQWMLSSAPRLAGERGERVKALLRARRWAAGELRREHPDLDDAWIPHLEAIGLGEEVKRWREHRPSGGAETIRVSRFTGLQPAFAEPGPDWADGFWVAPAEGPEDDDDEEAERPG